MEGRAPQKGGLIVFSQSVNSLQARQNQQLFPFEYCGASVNVLHIPRLRTCVCWVIRGLHSIYKSLL